MILGEVIGTVVSTRKQEALSGSKFLIIQCREEMGGAMLVAVDDVGAGIGELVIVATGSAARVQNPSTPVDARIIGIVDDPSKICFGK